MMSLPSDFGLSDSELGSSESGRAGNSSSDDPDPSIDECDDEGCRRPRKGPRTGISALTSPESEFTAAPHPTHDTSHVPFHVRNADIFARQVSTAVAEAWDYRFRYKPVYALLLMWEEDDLDVASEVSSLEDTLRSDYRYDTAV
ncbi:hypothetical protein B0H63DRAFT_76776 [Podospora didyma]|uniref:Uncharacterized protein n=1 Tax=Podospora didyma TaxID=330526 RepID=A0AAE0K1R1_9PEZI|nr:hypothetical protein B0H63DRAFT_76776 [Podospora didyma]